MFGSLSDFLAKSDGYVYKLADNLLDAITNGEHSRTLKDTEQVSSDLCLIAGLSSKGQKYLYVKVINANFWSFSPVQQREEPANTQVDQGDMQVRGCTNMELNPR